MRRTRDQKILGGRVIGVSSVGGGKIGKMDRIRDFAVARELAVQGKVGQARAILAKHDTGGAVIEIVPGASGHGEVK